MSQPRIELWSPKPLINMLPNRPMGFGVILNHHFVDKLWLITVAVTFIISFKSIRFGLKSCRFFMA